MKLPPVTGRLLVGSLCMSACTVPLFIGGTEDMTGDYGGSVTGTGDDPTTGDPDVSVGEGSTASPATTSEEDVSTSASSSGPATDDVPPSDNPKCMDPDPACDDGSGDLERALGLGCGSFEALGPAAFFGAADSRGVTAGLGAGPTFTPRTGAHAVLLSTGVAAHAALTVDAVEETTDCSQVGLPCPSTDFPEMYDLEALPPPLTELEGTCGEGLQPDGDCSKTIFDQWFGDPRLAHDYTEMRFSAVVPDNTIAVSLAVAFLTTERPTRFPGQYNDFLVVWLESEQWTGNIAIHPEQASPVAADALEFEHFKDAALADFAFADHAGTDWFRISGAVTPGDTVTLVIALFDESDGAADSAVLLDDLRWDCDAVTRP